MAFGKFGKYYPGDVESRPEDFDVVAAVREDFERVRSAEGAQHDMRFDSEPTAFQSRSDRLHLHYIVMNLLLNAVKYSAPGSRIDLRLCQRERAVVIEVEDRGIGVPQAELEQLFSPFYRASNVGERPGTGMGLAIVKKSAQLIGAQVTVRTAQPQGAIFTVTLDTGSALQAGAFAIGA